MHREVGVAHVLAAVVFLQGFAAFRGLVVLGVWHGPFGVLAFAVVGLGFAGVVAGSDLPLAESLPAIPETADVLARLGLYLILLTFPGLSVGFAGGHLLPHQPVELLRLDILQDVVAPGWELDGLGLALVLLVAAFRNQDDVVFLGLLRLLLLPLLSPLPPLLPLLPVLFLVAAVETVGLAVELTHHHFLPQSLLLRHAVLLRGEALLLGERLSRPNRRDDVLVLEVGASAARAVLPRQTLLPRLTLLVPLPLVFLPVLQRELADFGRDLVVVALGGGGPGLRVLLGVGLPGGGVGLLPLDGELAGEGEGGFCLQHVLDGPRLLEQDELVGGGRQFSQFLYDQLLFAGDVRVLLLEFLQLGHQGAQGCLLLLELGVLFLEFVDFLPLAGGFPAAHQTVLALLLLFMGQLLLGGGSPREKQALLLPLLREEQFCEFFLVFAALPLLGPFWRNTDQLVDLPLPGDGLLHGGDPLRQHRHDFLQFPELRHPGAVVPDWQLGVVAELLEDAAVGLPYSAVERRDFCHEAVLFRLAEGALLAQGQGLLAGRRQLLRPLALLYDGVFEGGGEGGDVGTARNEGEVAGQFGEALQAAGEPLLEVGEGGGEVVREGVAAAGEELAVGLREGGVREFLGGLETGRHLAGGLHFAVVVLPLQLDGFYFLDPQQHGSLSQLRVPPTGQFQTLRPPSAALLVALPTLLPQPQLQPPPDGLPTPLPPHDLIAFQTDLNPSPHRRPPLHHLPHHPHVRHNTDPVMADIDVLQMCELREGGRQFGEQIVAEVAEAEFGQQLQVGEVGESVVGEVQHLQVDCRGQVKRDAADVVVAVVQLADCEWVRQRRDLPQAGPWPLLDEVVCHSLKINALIATHPTLPQICRHPPDPPRNLPPAPLSLRRIVVDHGWKTFLTNFLMGLTSISTSSTVPELPRKASQIWAVGTWFWRVWLRTYCVVGSSWMVWMCVGMGMLRLLSWMAMGVSGFIISASSWVSPPVFWRFIRPFWIIFQTSYLAIRQRSYVPVIVTILRWRLEYSSLLKQTKAPVLVLMPLMVSPPLPISRPISLTGTSNSILCDPLMAPLFIFRCVSTIAFSSFLTRSTASGSPSTKMFLVLAPGAEEVATCTLKAPDFLAMFLMVSPSLPITSPTHSLGTSRMKALSEGGPQGVVSERLKSPPAAYASPMPCWYWESCSFFILVIVSSSEKIMRSISAQALATCGSLSPSTSTCRSSSSSQSPVGFCEPLPLTIILQPVRSSSCFWLLPLGPTSMPVQLKLLSLGRGILRLILLASFIMEKTPVLRPMGKELLPSTRVSPMPRFLLAGLSFFMRERFLISSREPQRFWCSLEVISEALLTICSSCRGLS